MINDDCSFAHVIQACYQK